MDNKPCCEKCRDSGWTDNIVGRACEVLDCPCHTPVVEGEWKEMFDKRYFVTNSGQIILQKDIEAGVISPADTIVDIKFFITNLLHSEREKTTEEIYAKHLDWETVARAEERERIGKICEEMKRTQNCNFEELGYHDKYCENCEWNSALSSLRDKLSTHND